jgi:hypothetical protein
LLQVGKKDFGPVAWVTQIRPNTQLPKSAVMVTASVTETARVTIGCNVLHEIEEMERAIGKRMYRGLLKSVASGGIPKTFRIQQSKRRCSHTCGRRKEDYAEPRRREGRLVWQLSRQFLGL